MAVFTHTSFICPECSRRSRVRSLDKIACEHCGWSPGKQQAARNKFNAVKKRIDGIIFDSGGEARRYLELKFQVLAKEIADLEVHPVFEYSLGPGTKPRRYTADFRYRIVATGEVIIEDFKGGRATVTTDYKLRKAAVEAQHGIVIAEVGG